MRLSTPILFAFLAGCSTLLQPPPAPTPQAEATPLAPVSAAPAAKPAAGPARPTAGAAPAKTAPTSPAASPTKQAGAAPAKQAGPAPLDLTTLEQQLKETKAIGVMTKLSIKNQVDDLLEQFRAYYQGRLKTTLADLRRPYEMLLMKVLSVLQDGDPALAGKINASREAIWGILADPKKFAQVGA